MKHRIHYDSIFVCQIKTTCSDRDEKISEKEVIEFGGCLLNLTSLQTHDPFSILVKPTSTEVSEFCTKRTGLTPEDVSSGVSFVELMNFVNQNYGTLYRPWASYGSFTKNVIKNQCRNSGIDFCFSDRFVNIKSLFPIIFNLNSETSLKEALKRLKLDIPFGGDCRDDAINASIIFKEMLRGPGILNGNFVTVRRKK